MSDEQLKLGCILPVPAETTATALPLQQTDVQARITGALAQVTVQQRFGNPLTEAIALRYLFPLPHQAAIVDYTITVGTRTIKAQMQERDAARRTYQEAAQQGQRASLLEQQRPNLFTIEIANVQPGETILTEVVYEERLSYDDGAYEFVFPMGITPRYHSRKIVQTSSNADVDAPVTADLSEVGPVTIQVTVDAGVPIADPTSRTHPLTLTRQDQRHLTLSLQGAHIPNKDFVLRYVVSGDKMQSAAWSSKNDEGDTALIMLIPPRLDLNEAAAPREFMFIIDRSGSMMGGPIEQAVNALKACLRALNETDTFWIQAFDDRLDWFDIKARPVTQANIEAADAWLSEINARGGTEILPAITTALKLPADKERSRYVVFLTDGAVSADEKAIAQIAKHRGEARIFSFGIGPSVNRYLLSKMAQMGRGVAEFLGTDDDIEGALTRFQDRVSYPALLDLTLTWHNATAWDTYPAALPDLYIGQPLEISTRLKRTGSGAARLSASGKARSIPVEFQADLPAPTEANPTIERLHARARIEALTDAATQGGDVEKVRRQIISLALEHRLMTPYTSFVAVDSETTQSTGGKSVDVAVPLPEGLKMEGFFGEQDRATGIGGSLASFSSPLMMRSPSFAPKARKAAPKADDYDMDAPEYERGITLDAHAFSAPRGDARLEMASRNLTDEIEDASSNFDNMTPDQLRGLLAATTRKEAEFSAAAANEPEDLLEEQDLSVAAQASINTKRALADEYKAIRDQLTQKLNEMGEALTPEPEKSDPPGLLRQMADKLFGRDQKKDESRTTGQFVDQIMKPAENRPDGPLGDLEPPNIELGLRHMARTQNVNGSWQDDVEMTAAALLAFVRAGHTTRKGQYRRQVQKAMTWLLSQLAATRGFAAFAALRALDDLYGASGDGEVPDSVRHSLPQPQTYLERAAMGEALPVPDVIDTLDAVRIAAFVQGNVRLPIALLQGEARDTAAVWALVGSPQG